MDDLRPSRTSMPSGVEGYAPGESQAETAGKTKKAANPAPPVRAAVPPPEVEVDDEEEDHQLDERA